MLHRLLLYSKIKHEFKLSRYALIVHLLQSFVTRADPHCILVALLNKLLPTKIKAQTTYVLAL